jgi:uncharacterized membrane protein YcaP (DUF421 family)
MLYLILKTLIIYLALLLMMRLLGKRQMGELELSELIVSILVADLASVPLQDPALPLSYGLLPCLTLFGGEYLMSYLTMKSIALRKLFCGRPSLLIVRGRILQDAMRKSRFTVDELAEELRAQNVNDPATVEYAVLETDGSLNVILYPEHRPATAGDLGLACGDDGYATILIEDGILLRSNLQRCGLDEAWLKKELKRRGCNSHRQVFAMLYYESGRIYFAEKD